jgi:hypothetical protein
MLNNVKFFTIFQLKVSKLFLFLDVRRGAAAGPEYHRSQAHPAFESPAHCRGAGGEKYTQKLVNYLKIINIINDSTPLFKNYLGTEKYLII